MEILLTIAGIFILLILYMNVRVTKSITRSKESSNKERVFSYLVVWFLPFIGVLIIPKKILPKLHSNDGSNSFTGGGGHDCGGADCG